LLETPMRAMVIDDSRAMRKLLSRVLLGMGMEVREACDGRDALRQLAESAAPDLALVDWNMPNMNGYDFVVAARQDPGLDAMRIVMVTTEIEMHRMHSALLAGANEYVMKPFTEDGLREKLGLLGIGREAA
jgi:two-component system, chemotaxis family, chemotaxis protein CheY